MTLFLRRPSKMKPAFPTRARMREVGKDLPGDSVEWKIVEAGISDCGYGFSHDTVSPELPLYADTRRCMGEHRCRRQPYPQSQCKKMSPTAQLSSFARIPAHLRSCTDAERGRVPPARFC